MVKKTFIFYFAFCQSGSVVESRSSKEKDSAPPIVESFAEQFILVSSTFLRLNGKLLSLIIASNLLNQINVIKLEVGHQNLIISCLIVWHTNSDQLFKH